MKTAVCIILSFMFLSFVTFDNNWVIIKSAKGDYQISFPKNPEEEQQTVPSELGDLKMNMLMLEVDDSMKDSNLVYLFNYTDYPEGKLNYSDTAMVESILEGAVKGAVKNVGGKLLSVNDFTYKEFHGKEARIDFRDGMAVIVMKCYLVKSRIYLLEVIALTAHDKNDAQLKFFNSFELLN